MRVIKKHPHYLTLLKNSTCYIFSYRFSGHKKYLIKCLFNELKIMLKQRLNKPLDGDRQAAVYVIPL